MEITTDMVKTLRDKTGVSVMQCKKALEETGGDMEKAIMVLLKKSADIALKKSDRTLGSGVVSAYIHATGRVGSMVELLCETDFVAKNEEFKKLAYDIAMHVSAMSPQFVKIEDIDEHANAMATEMFQKEIEAMPPARPRDSLGVGGEDMKVKILEGKLNSYWKERVLLDQAFIKNPEVTIRNLIESTTQKFGEKIELSRFSRFSIS